MDEGADMLLLEPALFCVDILLSLKQACRVPIALFSVSGEYLRLRSEGDVRLLIELFTMLKRSGQIRSSPMPPPTWPGASVRPFARIWRRISSAPFASIV